MLLVGFMGSGKTSVGRALAHRLGWAFLDFDAAIEQREGLTVPEIFRIHGEARFREIEAEVGAEALALDRVVLAAGGGWPARPGRMESLDPGTLTVWLLVSARTAVRRIAQGGPERPLLDTPDPVAEATRLLAAREPFYRLARHAVDSESASVGELARNIEGYLTRNRSASSS